MYLIARRTWCPFQQWKSKVSRWHSSMERYVFENRNFKRCFYSWVQGWKFVSSCRMVHWGSCQLTYLIYSIGGLLYEALPDVSQMVTGIPEFKKSMKVRVRDVLKENLIRGSFLSCSRSTSLEQPEGFEIHDRESHVCRWKKALYGLKQNTPGLV